MFARYWVAKYIPDVFRNEPQNVGVFVCVGDTVAARFLGETDGGDIDRRRLRRLALHHDVYRQWLTFWRRKIANREIEAVLKATTANFRVNEGGMVSDIGSDSAEQIATYLYESLVTDTALHEPISRKTGTESRRPSSLKTTIISELKGLRLLAEKKQGLLFPCPIHCDVDVLGKYSSHKPTFVQRNGNLHVMEPVDFMRRDKRQVRDHAGWAASMFRDIKLADENVITIGLVRKDPEDLENENAKSGLALLKMDANILIDWSNEGDRQQFLKERKQLAQCALPTKIK